MKKIISLFLAVCLALSLTACANNTDSSDDKLQVLFKEYLGTEVSDDGHSIQIDNLIFSVSMTSVEIEKKEGDYRIIVGMGHIDEGQILDNSLQQLKNEMNLFAEYFITFAKQQGLDNDYYLYVEGDPHTRLNFVYDYEEDKLYYNKYYDDFLRMYREFGTSSINDVARNEEGKNWLVENGFGELKHNEFESYGWTLLHHPFVHIDKNGEFTSRNLDEYI